MKSNSDLNYKFIFIANAALNEGLSGSDRIFQELARRWSRLGYKIEIAVWEDGVNICQLAGLLNEPHISLREWKIGPAKHLPFILCYFYRIFSGIFYALITNLPNNGEGYILYNCSDFWQDSLPSFILKLKHRKIKLIGSFYLTAPNPFKGFNEGAGWKAPTIKSFFYWLQQQPVFYLTRKLADLVYVTSNPDTKKFAKCVVVKGGVVLDDIKYRPEFLQPHSLTKEFDAVFLGRFHPQKGVVELVKIWALVVEKKPDALLVMIGDGPEMIHVKHLIHEYRLENNIQLKGFMYDGEGKYVIYQKSRLVLHPAIYDSGGMASVEAMAWGVPGVSFDLEALKTYYPRGMAKVPINNLSAFANEVLALLNDEGRRLKLSAEARSLALEEWDWDIRAEQILHETMRYL